MHLSHEVKEDLQHLGNERLHLLQPIRVKGINEATQRNHCINADLQQGNTQRQQSANKASMKVNEAAQCHYCVNTTCNKARHKLSLKALLMLRMPPLHQHEPGQGKTQSCQLTKKASTKLRKVTTAPTRTCSIATNKMECEPTMQ